MDEKTYNYMLNEIADIEEGLKTNKKTFETNIAILGLILGISVISSLVLTSMYPNEWYAIIPLGIGLVAALLR